MTDAAGARLPDQQNLGGRGRLGVRELVEGAARVLAEAGVGSPRVDATELAAFALGLDRLELVLAPAAPEGFAATYAGLVERRRLREPLQHITGRTGFRYLTMVVEPGVFVPRPETEVVAQAAVDEAAGLVGTGGRPIVVDLCCGAGGIAVSVATEVAGVRVWAVDANPAAVALTQRNAVVAGGEVVALVGDVRDPALLAELDGTVDVLVANPPYIPPDAVPIDPEVRDHDPDLALYGGGADGLDIPRAVIGAAVRLLRPGGLLVMEHAEVQDAQAREAAAHTGAFEQVRSAPDLTGRPRMLVARRNSEPRVKDSQP
jgi:release factor glutamine methyltransferase